MRQSEERFRLYWQTPSTSAGAKGTRLRKVAFRADDCVIRALLLILMSKQDDSFHHRGEVEEIVEESKLVAASSVTVLP